MDYMDGRPTPRIFAQWAAITAISHCVERRVKLETAMSSVYANLFTLLVAPPGVGKCLQRDELVLTFDGEAVPVHTIRPGHLLLGPDGTSRTVLKVGPGSGQLYKVVPNKGRSWKCNGEHILSLRKSRQPNKGAIKFVTVEEWLKWTDWQKSEWKLWRSDAVNFAPKEPCKIDPYFIGVMLGDGDSLTEGRGITITTKDREIVDYLYQLGFEWKLNIVQRDAIRYGVSSPEWGKNELLTQLRLYGMTDSCGEKRVPWFIKTGDVETRRQVLAGLMDTDGSYVLHGNSYDFISKSRGLSEDVAFISRSLGLAAKVSRCQKSCRDFTGEYWRVTISGEVKIIPCKIHRKKALARCINKEVTNTGFSIYPAEQGHWWGVVVDGDNQFLLDDFTVIHNTQAVDPIKSLIRDSKKYKLAPDNVTRASLVDAIQKSYVFKTFEGGKRILEYSSLFVEAGEFGVLVPGHDLSFLSILNRIYDNPDNYREERRTMEKSIDIQCPQLTILAGSQPSFLSAMLPEEAWSMGFTSRLILVYAGKSPRVKLFGDQACDRSKLKSSLTRRLADLSELSGNFHIEDTAKNALEAWAEDGFSPVPTHSKLQHYVPRRILATLKLCMVSALSRSAELNIRLEDFERARGWLLEAEGTMPEIFKEMSAKSDSATIQELHFYMWALWAKHKKPISEASIVHFLQSKVASEKVPRVMDVALRAGFMVSLGAGFYQPRPMDAIGVE